MRTLPTCSPVAGHSDSPSSQARRRSPIAILSFAMMAVWLLVSCESGNHIKAIDPSFGNISGNDDIVIRGSGFKPGMTVLFGKHEVKSVVIDSPTEIRVKTPSGVEGKVDVIITTEDGKTFGLREAFTYRRESNISK